MAELADKQIKLLKDKVLKLAERHRTIITTLKNDFKKALERSSHSLVQAKKRVSELENELESERKKSQEFADSFPENSAGNPQMAKALAEAKRVQAQLELELEEERKTNFELNKKLQTLEEQDLNKEIIKLKNSLNEEIQKSNHLANQLKSTALQDSDIQNLKEAAYSKAKIDRLEEDLKQEISRNARLRNDYEEKIHELENQLSSSTKKATTDKQQDTEKIKELEKQLEENRISLAKTQKTTQHELGQLQEKIQTLQNELQQYQKQLQQETESSNQKTEEINTLNETIKQLKKEHEENIQNINILVREQENEIQRLALITDRFDLISLGRTVTEFKSDVNALFKRGSQKAYRQSLQAAIDLQKHLKKNIEKINELTLNYHQEINELELQLRNHIFHEGPVAE